MRAVRCAVCLLTLSSWQCITLTDHCVLASSGMQADVQALHKNLWAKMQWFQYQHRKQMPLVSASQLLSNTLYGRRFFPFYAFNVLGGVDETGEGFVFGYDGMMPHVCVCVWLSWHRAKTAQRLETLKRSNGRPMGPANR